MEAVSKEPWLTKVRLCVLLTGELCSRPLLEAAEQVIAGGAQMIQLREKKLSDPSTKLRVALRLSRQRSRTRQGRSKGDREILKLADALRAMTLRSGTLFFVNDRPDIALMCGADGVHLGQDDLPVARTREFLASQAPGRRMWHSCPSCETIIPSRGRLGHLFIGASTHSLDQAKAAAAAGADYVAIGPVFPTKTKGFTLKVHEHGVGTGLVAEVARAVRLPVIAIGGITAENAGEVIKAGAHAVAVCSAIISAKDIRAATEKLLAALL